MLLLVNGLVFSVFSLIFFFLKTFADATHFGDVGIFFTISTSAMISIRFVMGALFDAVNKALLGIISLGLFAAGIGLMGGINSTGQFYGVAILYGMGIGAATPLLNSLMFVISKPEYRGMNTNLMLEMVDLGFFMGPLIGGLALAGGLVAESILACCTGVIILAAILLIPLLKTSPINMEIE